jgi:hypothetical protein
LTLDRHIRSRRTDLDYVNSACADTVATPPAGCFMLTTAPITANISTPTRTTMKVRVEAGTDTVNGVLNESAASNSANGQRRNEVAAERSSAAKPQTAQLDRLDLPLGWHRIAFGARNQPDPGVRFNSPRLERLQT